MSGGYCPNCGFGIGSQGHHDCCVTQKSTHTRNGCRINMSDADYAKEEHEADQERLVYNREKGAWVKKKDIEAWERVEGANR